MLWGKQAIALHLVCSHVEAVGEGLLLPPAASASLGGALCHLFKNAAMQAAAACTTENAAQFVNTPEAQQFTGHPSQQSPASAADVLEWALRVKFSFPCHSSYSREAITMRGNAYTQAHVA